MTNVVHPDFTERKALPAPNSDFYQLVEVLNTDELALVKKVRAYMETKVAPIINWYWSDDQFERELIVRPVPVDDRRHLGFHVRADLFHQRQLIGVQHLDELVEVAVRRRKRLPFGEVRMHYVCHVTTPSDTDDAAAPSLAPVPNVVKRGGAELIEASMI